MLLLNFAHPLTEQQLAALAPQLSEPLTEVRAIPCQFDHDRPFAEQVRALVDRAGLSADEWQTVPLLVNLPSLAVIAGLLLAEIHGRSGFFPPVLRLRPVAGSTPPRFEVAEVVNLQQVRDGARQLRGGA